jgi:hypothetical protein
MKIAVDRVGGNGKVDAVFFSLPPGDETLIIILVEIWTFEVFMKRLIEGYKTKNTGRVIQFIFDKSLVEQFCY